MNEEHKSGNKAVGAFIQDNDGNFLLIQRPDDCSYCPKQWEVPGGKMDPGETPEQAVVREVKEETGLTVKPKNVICEVEFEAKGKKLIMQYWIAEMVGGDIRLSQEHQACQWLSISDFGTKELKPALDGMWKQLTPPRHKQLVLDYKKERPNFVVYAEALERTLKKACKYSLPEALVQSRAKEVPSFAEKIVRKWDKYNDPIHQMTDLCGARIIVQTIEQVKAVGEFIEANFFICEKENKEVLLGKDKFGYRDLHYIIQLKKDRAGFLGIEEAKLQTIGDRKAEIQVRTWVQHAWADTLHDRMYKNKLKLSTEVVRTGNLLAALMEEGDRDFIGS